ncbi:MAG TPA: hypothetical protein PK581_07610 [Caldisericia bacterium]|nr:hypothetical protein [Caldisericia bacterium]
MKQNQICLVQEDTQLAFASIAMTHQLMTISKFRLGEYAGCIKSEEDGSQLSEIIGHLKMKSELLVSYHCIDANSGLERIFQYSLELICKSQRTFAKK